MDIDCIQNGSSDDLEFHARHAESLLWSSTAFFRYLPRSYRRPQPKSSKPRWTEGKVIPGRLSCRAVRYGSICLLWPQRITFLLLRYQCDGGWADGCLYQCLVTEAQRQSVSGSQIAVWMTGWLEICIYGQHHMQVSFTSGLDDGGSQFGSMLAFVRMAGSW